MKSTELALICGLLLTFIITCILCTLNIHTESSTSKANVHSVRLRGNHINRIPRQSTKTPQNTIINDNYCDFSGGSDEYLTSACSNILVGKAIFICDQGRTRLFTSRVGDGVRDCRDGSDEVDYGAVMTCTRRIHCI